MSKAKTQTGGRSFKIVAAMRANGAMTVREASTGRTYEIVDYVDELLEERMEALPKGEHVKLELVPIEGCDNICQATKLRPGGLPQPGLEVTLE